MYPLSKYYTGYFVEFFMKKGVKKCSFYSRKQLERLFRKFYKQSVAIGFNCPDRFIMDVEDKLKIDYS